ncbi:MAG: DUF1320 domain-containing protein [Rhizonema sp. NSF051]|nr:DUF1320 domain-containing protein [Rhizonema sp. NSF051]
MSYATVGEFIAAFPTEESTELSDLDFPRDYPVPARIQTALNAAYEEINTYRFAHGDSPPYSDHPPRLKQIEIIIARKNLNAYSWEESDPRYRDYKDVIGWLEKFAAGKVRLPIFNHQIIVQDADVVLPVSEVWANNLLTQIHWF